MMLSGESDWRSMPTDLERGPLGPQIDSHPPVPYRMIVVQ